MIILGATWLWLPPFLSVMKCVHNSDIQLSAIINTLYARGAEYGTEALSRNGMQRGRC